MAQSTSDGQGHVTILAQMTAPPRVPVDDIDREPMPPERPDDRAQWDEARGVWIEWDEVDHEWDVVRAVADDDAADEVSPERPRG